MVIVVNKCIECGKEWTNDKIVYPKLMEGTHIELTTCSSCANKIAYAIIHGHGLDTMLYKQTKLDEFIF
jgi:protein-arginine kinase activator protein McsA